MTLPVPASRVQFPATCRATGEPALLKALLVQIGTGEVSKHVPASAAKIEVVESAVLRLSVYKDQWPQPWSALCLGPLKAIIELCPPLQACDQVGCQCPCWHGLAGPRDPESILELWGRNFTTLQFRFLGPSTNLSGSRRGTLLSQPRRPCAHSPRPTL